MMTKPKKKKKKKIIGRSFQENVKKIRYDSDLKKKKKKKKKKSDITMKEFNCIFLVYTI